MTYSPAYPPKPQPGDRVAIISPAWAGPAYYPAVYELGLQRLRDELGLEPVEFPYTRVQGDGPQRAADIHAAVADPTIKAVLAVIGGSDQITVLRHLDRDLLKANPKPFFGYSDNTNLLHTLARAGVVGFHGGSVMVHLGRGGRTNQDTMASLRASLFTEGWFDLTPPLAFSEEPGDWGAPESLVTEPVVRPAPGHWEWHRPDQVITGRTWGGCLEVLVELMIANVDIPTPEELAGQVLFLETSEEMPQASFVECWLVAMGERGLLSAVAALVMARPKAWERQRPFTLPQREVFAAEQKAAVLAAMDRYNPSATIVFDVDFGHTDPQLIIPYGGDMRIDGPGRTISVRY